MKKNISKNKGDIVIYRPKGKEVEIRVKLEKETIWLTQAQITFLFGVKRPAITKHLNNIFRSRELDRNSVCSILEHTATDGKTYETGEPLKNQPVQKLQQFKVFHFGTGYDFINENI